MMLAQPAYLTYPDIVGDRLASGEYILGVIGFGTHRPASLHPDCPFANIDMHALDSAPSYEVWTSPSPVTRSRHGRVTCSISGTTMFGIVEPDPAEDSHMESLARTAYREIFAASDTAGYPHVLRVYNYLARITETEHGLERYRHFNLGRHEIFQARGHAMQAAPAASGLGLRHGNSTIYFLASSAPGITVENPRQVSAYHYPPLYGPRSPSFSRAMIAHRPHGAALFISGTASIVGHESVHHGDVGAQTDEIRRNFAALYAQCRDKGLVEVEGSLALKLYLRHAEDLPVVRQRLSDLPAATRIIALEADICRPELLVEIEGFAELREEAVLF
jgi:chorismate lyase/3-hydroxybenzoate synthase